MQKYVIIGNGVGAVGCIEGIRSMDKESKIVVISEEKHHVYCRPLISYYLEDRTDLERMKYRDDGFYDRMNCEVLYGVKATEIDKDAKKVKLSDGNSVDYTKLCVASGSSAFVPPFEGLDTVENKFSFMTLDDALAIEKAITKDSKVLIIGAGLIGLKCAEGIKEKVASITVCDLADRVLSSILDKECADMVQKHLEDNGIDFMLCDSAVSFDKNKAVMKSGKTVDFDILVLAVGVRANTSLIGDIGGEVNRGIVIDDSMKTTVPDIYAVGDCSEGNDISLDAKRVLALLPNAYMQGNCAGANMAGGSDAFSKAIPMNAIGFFGMHIMTAGTYFSEEDGGEVYEEKSEGKYKKLFTRDGLLTGFILINDNARAGIYTSLIREKTPLDTVDFEMMKKTPTSMAFSSQTRRKMFGGVL